MAILDPQVAEQVMSYVSGARWFAGKGRRAELYALSPLPWLTSAEVFADTGLAVRCEVAEIGYPSAESPPLAPRLDPTDAPETGEDSDRADPPEMMAPSSLALREHYQLVMAYRSAPHPDLQHAEIARLTDPELGPVIAYDAAQDPQACRVVLRSLLAGRRLRSPDAEIRFQPGNTGALTADVVPQVFRGQQSNTSVMLGDIAILKFFRRLELGRNLDIEVHAALNKAGVSDVATLYGSAEGSWVSGGRQFDADLAMVVEKLRECRGRLGTRAGSAPGRTVLRRGRRGPRGRAPADPRGAAAGVPDCTGARCPGRVGDERPAAPGDPGRAESAPVRGRPRGPVR